MILCMQIMQGKENPWKEGGLPSGMDPNSVLLPK